MLRSADTQKYKYGFQIDRRWQTVCVKAERATAPREVIGYFRILEQVDEEIYGVLPGQGAVTVHDDVEHELESLVDVL